MNEFNEKINKSTIELMRRMLEIDRINRNIEQYTNIIELENKRIKEEQDEIKIIMVELEEQGCYNFVDSLRKTINLN
jgi:polysaccharide deacetylase 2 family uncharacterized protein YibQ